MSKSIDKDDFLARLLKSGDPQAITALYRLYFKQVVRVAPGIVKDQEIGKDIAQELFIRIWEKRKELNFHTSLENYLMRSAINQLPRH